MCPKPSDLNWMPGPSLITTRIRTTPSLLRLSWTGYPLYYDETHAWSYIFKDEKFKKAAETAKSKEKKLHKKKLMNQEDYIINKIPHKDGEEVNVGNPLSKSFLSKIKEGTLTSYPKRSAELALELYSNISYWENNEKRIKYFLVSFWTSILFDP